MSSSDDGKKVNRHFVCTHAQARALIEGQNQFYIGMCGCRERQGGCSRSQKHGCGLCVEACSSGCIEMK